MLEIELTDDEDDIEELRGAEFGRERFGGREDERAGRPEVG